MQANYDALAGIYDRLSRLVYGDAIYRSQAYLLKAIPPSSTILIIGGGTGWILEVLAGIHPQGLHITYVEASQKMMQRSFRRNAGENKVTFICSPIQEAALEHSYNVVITPFLLDNFSDHTLAGIFSKIDAHLSHKGLWLFADFQKQENKLRSKILLKLMYLFFGFLCKLETAKLPDTNRLFQQYRYKALGEEFFYNDFIHAVVYQKQPAAQPFF